MKGPKVTGDMPSKGSISSATSLPLLFTSQTRGEELRSAHISYHDVLSFYRSKGSRITCSWTEDSKTVRQNKSFHFISWFSQTLVTVLEI